MPPCPPGSKGPECTKKKQIPSQNARALKQKTLDFAKQKTTHTNRGDGMSKILEGTFVVGILYSYFHLLE